MATAKAITEAMNKDLLEYLGATDMEEKPPVVLDAADITWSSAGEFTVHSAVIYDASPPPPRWKFWKRRMRPIWLRLH